MSKREHKKGEATEEIDIGLVKMDSLGKAVNMVKVDNLSPVWTPDGSKGVQAQFQAQVQGGGPGSQSQLVSQINLTYNGNENNVKNNENNENHPRVMSNDSIMAEELFAPKEDSIGNVTIGTRNSDSDSSDCIRTADYIA